MKTATKLFLPILLAVWTVPAAAFDRDIHYHMMYYLARQVGFPQSLAATIAGAAQYVDDCPKTDPVARVDVTGISQEQRRFFHFPKWDYVSGPDTTRNSFFGNYNIRKAISDASSQTPAVKQLSPYRFGLAAHVMEDTWAHEGFGFVVGHAYEGHFPDRPYWSQGNLIKTEETARRMFDLLIELYRGYYGTAPKPPEWSKIRGFVMNAAVHCVEKSWSDSYAVQEAQRCTCWENYFTEEKLDFVPYVLGSWETGDKNSMYMKAFLRYCLPHKAPPQKDSSQGSYVVQSFAAAPADFVELPLLGDYCDVLQSNVGSDPVKIAGFLLDRAPWMMKSSCVRETAASEAVLEAWMATLGDPGRDVTYEVAYLFDQSAAPLSVKSSVLRKCLESEAEEVKLFAANFLVLNDGELREQAQTALLEAWRDASTPKAREFILPRVPPRVEFLEVFTDAIVDGSLEEKGQAARALFTLEDSASRTVLRKAALKFFASVKAGSDPSLLPVPLTHWLVKGLGRPPEGLDTAASKKNQDVLVRLLKNFSGDEQIVRPSVEALRSYYAAESRENQERIARSLIGALDVEDLDLRWHAGYSLVVVSGQDFDLTYSGLAKIRPVAVSWFEKEFAKTMR